MASREAQMRGIGKSGRPGAVHEGFLRYRGMFWGKIALGISVLLLIAYWLIDVEPRHNGGSWYGYTLGTAGALLIIWLTMLGVRKRAMTPGRWSLKAWTSAHVYLGLALLVIGTLHTGFQLGWNVHTLAWALMVVVILSGLFGVTVYALLPSQLSHNRDEATEEQMLATLADIDRRLFDAAQPLESDQTVWIEAAREEDPFGGRLLQRLRGRYGRGDTADALAAIRSQSNAPGAPLVDAIERVEGLLERRLAALTRIRRHLRYKSLLQVWLHIHVPVTFALLAALSAHIVSVFFYW